ncbi:MAG: hypothetical protein R6V21_01320 [Pelovirga sp.]
MLQGISSLNITVAARHQLLPVVFREHGRVTMTGLASPTRSVKQKKKYKATTNSKHDLPVARNFLD